MLDLRPFDSTWHAAGSVSAQGMCAWHGSEHQPHAPVTWSFSWRWRPGCPSRVASCDRGLEEAMGQGLLVGQAAVRRVPRAHV